MRRRPPRQGRAGRDLPLAIGVGVGLALLALATLYVRKPAFVVLAALVVVLALAELANAFTAVRVRLPLVPVALGGVAMVVGSYRGGGGPLALILVGTAAAALAWPLATGGARPHRDAAAGIFAAAYVPFLAGFAMLLLRAPDGPDRIVVLILLTACSDVGGYATGVLFGRHPMAPAISPKKSWEGFAGSVLLGAFGGALAVPALLAGPVLRGAGLGAAVAITATLGDLGESVIKRRLGIKDMGTLLPGHGGVMDRLDSLLPTAPVVYLLLSWLVPPPG